MNTDTQNPAVEVPNAVDVISRSENADKARSDYTRAIRRGSAKRFTPEQNAAFEANAAEDVKVPNVLSRLPKKLKPRKEKSTSGNKPRINARKRRQLRKAERARR